MLSLKDHRLSESLAHLAKLADMCPERKTQSIEINYCFYQSDVSKKFWAKLRKKDFFPLTNSKSWVFEIQAKFQGRRQSLAFATFVCFCV